MYFAKVNVNKDIYAVYKDSKKLEEIFTKLSQYDWQKSVIVHTKGNRLNKEENKEEHYKFINIDFVYDKNYVVGRLIEIFQDDLSLYDKKKDEIGRASCRERV